MAKVTFTVVSTSDRVDWLNEMVESIMRYPKFDEYDLCLCFQDYLGNQEQIKYRDRYSKIIVMPERMGCNGARVHLLNNISYDYYINLDDDMRMTEYTDYSAALKKCEEPSTGFVLTAWARSEAGVKFRSRFMKDMFREKIITLQGGGMVYSNEIADIIRKEEVRKTMFDDNWAIATYINGCTNYEYYGSLTIHNVESKGGMLSFMAEEQPPLACPEYVNYTKWILGNYIIPNDYNVTELAHELHKKNLKG